MSKEMKKNIAILAGSIGGAVAVCAAAVSIWNSRQMRTMRTIRRTNAIMNRVGNVLCRISEA